MSIINYILIWLGGLIVGYALGKTNIIRSYTMKLVSKFFSCLGVLLLVSVCMGQTSVSMPPQPVATGDTITVTFNLSPITLPDAPSSIAGAETDIILPFTTNNWIGETSIVSSNYSFVGGKYMRIFPNLVKYLGKVSPLNFTGSDIGVTASGGVVFVNNTKHWGGTAGVFWMQNINSTWAMTIDAEAVRFPYVSTEAWTWKMAVGPNIKF